eukprot:GHVL01012280.1.p1 GENE.GHVL01012280.1~~GHVL01012280.1.p1  ORF type:complete len:236 (+),score=33.09 GHVL01012280.1:30-737(+)
MNSILRCLAPTLSFGTNLVSRSSLPQKCNLIGLPQKINFIGSVRWVVRSMHLNKRKKKNKRPMKRQPAIGRRLEFFWKKRSRRTRIPLYQNIRPNVIYDTQMRRWMVMWYRTDGVQVFRPFNTHRGIGYEKARTKALRLQEQLQQKGWMSPDGNRRPDKLLSGVRGVFFDHDERIWVATWNSAGIRTFRAFPAAEMGFDEAYQAAIAVRRQKVVENHKFVMQKIRWRNGGHYIYK